MNPHVELIISIKVGIMNNSGLAEVLRPNSEAVLTVSANVCSGLSLFDFDHHTYIKYNGKHKASPMKIIIV